MFTKGSSARAKKVTNMKRNSSSLSLVSQGAQLNGNIHSEGEIQIDGSVSGTICAHTVTVTHAGRVNGEIRATCVRINGTVEGKIEGETVSLGQSARVMADIQHGAFDVERGAFFNGECRPLVKQQAEDDEASLSRPDSQDDSPLMLVSGDPQSA